MSLNSEVENEVFEPGEHYYDKILFSKLPKGKNALDALIMKIDEKVSEYQEEYIKSIELNKGIYY